VPSDPPPGQSNESVTERERFDSETAFRGREIVVKEDEIKFKKLEYSRSRLTNPLVVVIFTAMLAALGNIFVAYLTASKLSARLSSGYNLTFASESGFCF
jgi:hypothetical protein